MARRTTTKTGPEHEKKVPIVWDIPPDAGATFVNQFAVQSVGGSVREKPNARLHIFSVFEVQRPLLLTDQQAAVAFAKIKEIPALLRGRFLLPWDILADLGVVLVRHALSNCPDETDRVELVTRLESLLSSSASSFANSLEAEDA